MCMTYSFKNTIAVLGTYSEICHIGVTYQFINNTKLQIKYKLLGKTMWVKAKFALQVFNKMTFYDKQLQQKMSMQCKGKNYRKLII